MSKGQFLLSPRKFFVVVFDLTQCVIAKDSVFELHMHISTESFPTLMDWGVDEIYVKDTVQREV